MFMVAPQSRRRPRVLDLQFEVLATWRNNGTQPQAAHSLCGLRTRSVDAGYLASMGAGRIGRRSISPPQFWHRPPGRRLAAQAVQKVHSNEQIRAFAASGGRSRSQHSQLGLRFSIADLRYLPRLGAMVLQASTSVRTASADFSNMVLSAPFN